MFLALTIWNEASHADEIEDKINALVCRNPIRRSGGTIFDLQPAFAYETNFAVRRLHQFERPFPDWKVVYGHVQQVLQDGLLVRAKPTFGNVEGLIYLTNHPAESVIVDGNPVACFARENGRYQYVSVLGGGKTIPSFDYGSIPPKAEIDAALESSKRIEELRQERIRNAVQVHQSAAKQKLHEADRRLLAFQMQQATNGNPSFQYELGLRYLSGNGVQGNTNEALRWLREAARRGYKPAEEKLKNIPEEQH
jgi:hypothetical protein